ncbi:MAG: hypothetical protein V1668_02910 [Patescibacteria group bacterium]
MGTDRSSIINEFIKNQSRVHLIEEFCPTGSGPRIILRTRSYWHTLDYFQFLFKVALNDFPEIKPEDVEIIQYGGGCVKRTFGIEFNVKDGTAIPGNYKQIAQVELTI